MERDVPSAADLQRLDAMQQFREQLEKATKPLMADPLSETATKNKALLLAASAACILATYGVEITEVGGAKAAKFSGTALVLATMLAALYGLTVYLAGYLRDIRVWKELRKAPAYSIAVLNEKDKEPRAKAARALLVALEQHKASAKAQSGTLTSRVEQERAAKERVVQAERDFEGATERSKLIEAALERAEALEQVHLKVDLWLPLTIAILAIGNGIVYVLAKLR